jgi:hypothetical protein
MRMSQIPTKKVFECSFLRSETGFVSICCGLKESEWHRQHFWPRKIVKRRNDLDRKRRSEGSKKSGKNDSRERRSRRKNVKRWTRRKNCDRMNC